MILPRVWLVTGSSSGIGRAMVELALAKGDKVVATLRKPHDLDELSAKYLTSQLLVVKLDVTQPQEIIAAFARAKDAFGRVDVVLNNAGFLVLGEVEGTPDDVARSVFETNFWGAANVNREAVRFFREENPEGAGGRLLVVSSTSGLKPYSCAGYYSATKSALESVTQALASELEPSWNIKITLLPLGTFRTPVANKGVEVPAHPAYTSPTNAAAKVREWAKVIVDPTVKLNDVHKGAQKMYELTTLENPPLRLLLGRNAFADIREQIALLTKDVDEYESWTEGILED